MTGSPTPAPELSDGDLEQAALAAAEEAFARVMTGVPEQIETMPPGVEPADAVRWAGDRVTELLAGFAELPLDRLLGLDAQRTGASSRDHGQPTPPTDVDSPGPVGEPLTFRGVRGSATQARVWVHSVGDVAPARMCFVLASMVGPDGSAWTQPEAAFEPAELALPAPTGASTLLKLSIPAEAVPGSHHGLVIGRGVAGAAIPIIVVIT